MKIRIVSLFSGLGFQEMALFETGIQHEIVAYCEIDKKLSACFSALHGVPETRNLGDIRKINLQTLGPKLGNIDLLISTFPCQSFSIAGKRRGIRDQKNGDLLLFNIEFIYAVRPKIIVFENVKNITSASFGIIPKLKKVLHDIGYTCSDKILNAADYGLPQNRERWFMVCSLQSRQHPFIFPSPIVLETTVADYLEAGVSREMNRSLLPFLKKKFCKWGKYGTRSCCIKLFDGVAEGYFEHGFSAHRIYSIFGCAPTFTTTNDCNFFEIRGKLTAKERFLLMGGNDSSFEVVETFLTSREIDKACGNGVAVPVMRIIFEKIFQTAKK